MINQILADTINLVFMVLWWAILAKVIISWLPMLGMRIDPYNPVIQILNSVTDPILDPLRKYTTVGMMDFSPIVALVGLELIRQLLISLLVV